MQSLLTTNKGRKQNSLKPSTSKERKKARTKWQDVALEVCEKYDITGVYKTMIFTKAKKNLSYLEGRIATVEELKPRDPGRYLISLFRKQ